MQQLFQSFPWMIYLWKKNKKIKECKSNTMEISCQLPFQFACDFTISDINVSGEYLYSIMWKEKLLPLPLT